MCNRRDTPWITSVAARQGKFHFTSIRSVSILWKKSILKFQHVCGVKLFFFPNQIWKFVFYRIVEFVEPWCIFHIHTNIFHVHTNIFIFIQIYFISIQIYFISIQIYSYLYKYVSYLYKYISYLYKYISYYIYDKSLTQLYGKISGKFKKYAINIQNTFYTK